MADNRLDTQIEKLTQAIKLTQKLRASVTKVFTDLSDGFQAPKGDEKALLNKLQKSLTAVNDNLGDLEKLAPNIHSTTNIPPLLLNSVGLLGLDPATDKSGITTQLHHTHKWTNKVHKLGDYTAQFLGTNQLKRTNQGPAGQAKRLRRPEPTIHRIPENINIQQLVASVDRAYADMSVSLIRPMGNSTVLQITLAKTLKAVIVLRGLLIEYVSIKAYSEDFLTDDGRPDIWSKSKYQVFNKVTDLVTAGTIHFYHPQLPDASLKSFLIWLNNYKTLFSAPCSKCGKYLQGFLPPIWRDTRSSQPLHDGCRQ
ncbi:mediator of RNA polymerase II transcription subunit 27-A-like [Crassostrea angulata]|uniref:Mediator of RNA polymerase II transcription subunit 27 n=1 Tax=Magallana gigas TaxID=29159 RepID=A0A8W8HMT5_MAGGI|nr:mediator of RNA polymerase II transcription subunit 27-A [Crassostrea gigas]XP_052698230.1 mediator of RNA polymerase II transcription subunit 27-A-like [Crassostrea angulata]|eukprot:XP_011426531.1 PREDICTED: mediator of RNA polymerase II transcription subunit 27-A [Crassostrea gigas]